MTEKTLVILQIVLFFCLTYTLFNISRKGQVTTSAKWILMLCSMGILAIADKVKLFIWVIMVSIIWVVQYLTTKKENNDRLA